MIDKQCGTCRWWDRETMLIKRTNNIKQATKGHILTAICDNSLGEFAFIRTSRIEGNNCQAWENQGV